jgi:hypothetical protein
MNLIECEELAQHAVIFSHIVSNVVITAAISMRLSTENFLCSARVYCHTPWHHGTVVDPSGAGEFMLAKGTQIIRVLNRSPHDGRGWYKTVAQPLSASLKFSLSPLHLFTDARA